MDKIKQLEKEFQKKFVNDHCYLADQFKANGNCTQDVWRWIEDNFIPKDEMWAKFNEAISTVYVQNNKIEELENQLRAIRGGIDWIKI